MRRYSLFVLATALLLGSFGCGADAPRAAGSGSSATLAAAPTAPLVWAPVRVQVRVMTTSDWSTVQVRGAGIAARRTTAVAGTRMAELGDGWSFKRAGSFAVDVVLATPQTDLTVLVAKGYIGRTIVEVTGPAGTILRVVNDRRDTSRDSSANRVSSTLRRVLLDPAVVRNLKHGDDRRLALAFAYPWFSSYDDNRLAERPADPRSWTSAAGVESMTRQAREAGLDGFVLSYAGEANTGAALDLVLRAAQATGGVVSPYLETEEAVKKAGLLGSPAAVVEDWLRSALRRSAHPAFLTAQGKPVVFVFSMGKLTVAQWAGVRRNLEQSGHPVLLVGDTGAPGYTAVSDGFHHYGVNEDMRTLSGRSQYASTLLRAPSVLDPALTPQLAVGTVSPGYDDTKLRGWQNPIVHRDYGRRYDDTWAASLSGDPDWVVVTSWNEWYEGTEIEPGTNTGSLALTQTREHITAWRAAG